MGQIKLLASFDLDSTSNVLVVIQLDFEMKESHFLEWSIFSLKNQIGWISWSLFSFSINQLIFWALEFQMIIDFAHFISKYLFWINCLKDNYGFLEFTISDLSNADTVCTLGAVKARAMYFSYFHVNIRSKRKYHRHLYDNILNYHDYSCNDLSVSV